MTLNFILANFILYIFFKAVFYLREYRITVSLLLYIIIIKFIHPYDIDCSRFMGEIYLIAMSV